VRERFDAVETPLNRMKKSQKARHRLFFAASTTVLTGNIQFVVLTSIGGAEQSSGCRIFKGNHPIG